MKKILLSISILLSLFGIWWLATFNFLNFAFSWQDFVFYTGIAAINYLLIRWIGGSLDKEFRSVLDSFIKGDTNDLNIKRGLLSTYGFLQVALLPFLIYLLLLSLFAAISFSLYGFLLIANVPRIPVAILLALAVIPLGTLIGVLIGIYRIVSPVKRDALGIKISKKSNKKLWQVINDVSEFLKTPPVDKVIIKPESGVGVYLKGNNISAIRGVGTRTIEIGLPSIDGLTISQFKAILAHEYGHLSNKDAQWSSFTFAMGQGLTKALASTPGPSRDKKSNNNDDDESRGGLFSAIVSLNPAWWILLIYTNLYFAVTGGFQRAKEVIADLNAIELAGGQNFRDGLKKVVINSYIFSEYVQKHLIWDMLKDNKVITNFSKIVRHAESNLTKEERVSIEKAALATHKVTKWDTHPPVDKRLNYASRFRTVVEGNKKPVTSLFDDWDNINERVAELYNKKLISLVKAYADYENSQKESKEGGD